MNLDNFDFKVFRMGPLVRNMRVMDDVHNLIESLKERVKKEVKFDTELYEKYFWLDIDCYDRCNDFVYVIAALYAALNDQPEEHGGLR